MFSSVTERCAAPSATPGLPPAERPRSEGTGDSPLQSVDRTETRSDVDRERSSTVRRQAYAMRAYNTTAEAKATFLACFSPPTNWSWRSTCRKCTRRRTVRRRRDSPEGISTPAPPHGRQVESDTPTLRSSPFASSTDLERPACFGSFRRRAVKQPTYGIEPIGSTRQFS
jgi:hypothetical protein